MNDPGEIRWARGFVRIGYLGGDRWRLDVGGAERGVRESSTGALIELVMKALESVPRGAPVPIAGAPNAVARDLGIVSFSAPGECKQVRVAWREDLVGVLPRTLPLVDVVASIVDGSERPHHAPLIEYASHWLWFRAERCWAVGVPLPPDRLGASSDAEQTFHQAMRELDALGHDRTFADSDGQWVLWASRYLVASFSPGDDGGPGVCQIELAARAVT